jgi:hypothetical protein
VPIFLKDLLEKPDVLTKLTRERCSVCNVELQETITGKRETPSGFACSDCYYGQLGEEIELHPIGSAGIRRA